MGGITKDGIEIERLKDIIEDLSQEVKNVFGADSRTDANSVFGLIIGILSRMESENWELIEKAYNSRTLKGAIGTQLDALGEIIGARREPPQFGVGVVQIGGVNGTSVPKNTRYQDDLNRVWVQVDDATIQDTTNADVRAEELGSFIAGAGTITTIVDNITGLKTVTNSTPTTIGQEIENDAKYRARLFLTAQGAGLGFYDALYYNLFRLEQIEYVGITENATDTEVDGVPPHSFEVVIKGADNQSVADTIWHHKPAGILTHGSTSQEIIDFGGKTHTVNFTRPAEVPIFIIIEIKALDGWQNEYSENLKQAVVDFASVDFTTGDDVIQSRLYIATNVIPAQSTQEIYIGTADAPTLDDDIPITHKQLATFDTTRVEVVLV